MIQEYLISEKDLVSKIEDFSSESTKQDIQSIRNSFVLSISMDGQNEHSAKELSIIHEKINAKYNLVVLSNGSSEYFNKSLFPLVNEFERKLRKLLYLAVALGDTEGIEGIENITNLEKENLGKIFELLFTDGEFNKKTRNIGKSISYMYSKKWLLDYVETIIETTLWGQLVGAEIEYLSNDFRSVQEARNSVMHAHNINYSEFVMTKKMFNSLNKDIDNLINSIDEEKEEDFGKLLNLNAQLSERLRKQSESISEAFKPIMKILEEKKEIINTGSVEIAYKDKIEEIMNQIEMMARKIGEIMMTKEDE